MAASALLTTVAALAASTAPAPPPPAVAAVSAHLGAADSAYSARHAALRNGRLVARFGPDGVRLSHGGEHYRVRLAGPGVAPRVAGNRVSYERRGVTEFYVNGPSGLEQGFTLRRPRTLVLHTAGGRLTLDPDRRGLQLGRGLTYRGLWATDARGHDVKAWLQPRGRHAVALRVDDAHARYPITIDPFFRAATLAASDAAPGDELGFSVATSGDTLAAGAPNKNAVYVFTKPAAGWASATQTAKLTASDSAPLNRLGFSVATDGATIVAGNPDESNGDEGAREGSAYVWEKPAGGWHDATQTAKLTLTSPEEFAELGASVAVQGTTVAVGAPGFSTAIEQTGAAFTFERPAGGWAPATHEAARLLASDPALDDHLGTSVDLDGGLLAAGAPAKTVGGRAGQGIAYVFRKPAAGWRNATQDHRLQASDGAAGDHLGASVAVSGATVAAGAPGDDGGRGAAYVFDSPRLTIEAETAKLTAAQRAAADALGSGLALDGDTLVAMAPGVNVGTTSQGAAYIFRKPAGGWESLNEFARILSATDGGATNFQAAGLAGGTLAVGESEAGGGRGRVAVWAEDTVAPSAPAITATDPPSPAQSATPHVIGTAESASTVRLFTNGSCSGAPAVTGSAAEFAAPGLAVTLPANATTTFSAIAVDAAGNESPCGVGATTYQSDGLAPVTQGIAGPQRVAAGSSATYTLNAGDAGSGVAGVHWTADGGLPAANGATVTYTFAAPGTYTLRAGVSDRAGNRAADASVVVTVTAAARRITSVIANNWLSARSYTTVLGLAVRDVPAGAAVEVRCSGPKRRAAKHVAYGCPYQAKRFKPALSAHTVNLLKPFVKRRLLLKTRLEIRITAPAMIGRDVRYTVVAKHLPKQQALCLAPGAKGPSAC